MKMKETELHYDSISACESKDGWDETQYNPEVVGMRYNLDLNFELKLYL